MNDFEATLLKLVEESQEIKKREGQLRADMGLFNEKLMGFLKQSGLPENFTIPELALLAVRKSRDLIKLS